MHFVDTNILVYPHDSKEPAKRDRASALMDRLWRNASGRLSFQVLQEFYAVTTRKLNPGLKSAVARKEIRELLAWAPPPVTPALLERAWKIEDRWRLSCWDSLIVASALQQDCRTLLTEDFQDGLEIEGIRILNPFAKAFDLTALDR